MASIDSEFQRVRQQNEILSEQLKVLPPTYYRCKVLGEILSEQLKVLPPTYYRCKVLGEILSEQLKASVVWSCKIPIK